MSGKGQVIYKSQPRNVYAKKCDQDLSFSIKTRADKERFLHPYVLISRILTFLKYYEIPGSASNKKEEGWWGVTGKLEIVYLACETNNPDSEIESNL